MAPSALILGPYAFSTVLLKICSNMKFLVQMYMFEMKKKMFIMIIISCKKKLRIKKRRILKINHLAMEQPTTRLNRLFPS